ncbi:hypothetical protein [Sphingomonas sp.]|uniref:hypothetical protein n=1 Tax=Sphingomonas sp. TaxID=28214 RepID=UPI002DD6329E|nr:hypothetical protein [Sphingomonas sp.]
MIVLILALLQVPDPIDRTKLDEMVRQFRFSAAPQMKGQRASCKVDTSSGNALLDKQLCETALTCLPPKVAKMPTANGFPDCFAPRFDALKAEWAKGRRVVLQYK